METVVFALIETVKRLDLVERILLAVGMTGTAWGLWVWKERGFAPDPSQPPDRREWELLAYLVALVVVVVCTGWLGGKIHAESKELGEKLERIEKQLMRLE